MTLQTFQRLPNELIRDIIRFSTPIVRHSTFRERYDMLLTCSLVSSVWRDTAQEELMEHLLVKDTLTTFLLVNQLRRKELDKKRYRIISLRLYGTRWTGYPRLENVSSLLKYCTKVYEVWLSGLDLSTFFGLRLTEEWSNLANVESLHFIECYLSSPIDTSISIFSTITHLSLYDIHSLPLLFTIPSTFPHLFALTFITFKSNQGLVDVPQDITNRITTLTIHDEKHLIHGISNFTHLETLILRDVTRLEELPPTLPPSLTALHFNLIWEDADEEIEALKQWFIQNDPSNQITQLRFPELINIIEEISDFQSEQIEIFADDQKLDLDYTESIYEWRDPTAVDRLLWRHEATEGENLVDSLMRHNSIWVGPWFF